MTTPDLSTRVWVSLRVVRLGRGLKRGTPPPSSTGLIPRRYSSTRPFSTSSAAKSALPKMKMVPPSSAFRRSISATASPATSVVLRQSAFFSEREKTYFSTPFMKVAMSPSAPGQ
ncbi:hypothetical protein FQZ97_1253870 [compost metagenome]